jgi:excinuclease ABC subunit C
MSSFLMQFYTAAAFVPGEILLQEDIDELEIIEKWLGGRRDGRVHIRVPRRGEKHQLVEMVGQNAVMALKQFKLRLQEQGTLAEDGLKGLTNLLQLEDLPQRIEAYDISNTGTSEMVGSLVVFEEGKPNTGEYRRFKIKTQSGQNDYGSMQEVLFRRFRHAEREVQEIREAGEEETGRGKFTVLPDLILLDGGLGHVHAAEEVLKELGINLPAFGMVKDDRHRTRGLVARDGREMDLSGNLPVLRFVTAIQDEAHRFALAYNKALRKKRLSTSILDEIPGVGPQRRKTLIKHFGSAARVRRATLEELVEVKGMSRSLAESIVLYFDKQ